jgi:hypothetical protein
MPEGVLSARLGQRLLADRDDQVALSELVQEAVGAQRAARGVAPPDQRLDAGKGAGLQVDGRLVDEEELVALRGAPARRRSAWEAS